jgi:hypothetical protein
MATAWGGARQYARRLDDTPWLTVLGYAYASFITLAMLMWLLPARWRTNVKGLELALPLLLLVAKDLSQIPDVPARLHSLRRAGAGWLSYPAACLPPGLIGLMRLGREQRRGFLCWMCRESPPARPAGLRLTFQEQGAYSTMIALALFTVLGEIPLDAAILPLLVKDPAQVQAIHLVLALGGATSLVWVLGDRWRVRNGYHVLTETHLDLEVGARASARIPRDAIADAQPLRKPVAEWRRAHPVPYRETVNITPFDKPNLVLRLRDDASCTITHHGLERTGVRYVFLYLDRPERLIAALAPAA